MTTCSERRVEELVLAFFENGVIQFGSFTLKSGAHSPFYIDLRRLISNPKLLLIASECIWNCVKHLDFDIICGVPYGAVGLAGAISVNHKKSLIMKRKAPKGHGTKKILEGVYNEGDRCLVIEDLVTSGTSVLETNFVLEDHTIQVKDVAVVVDREQGGKENLAKAGYTLHSVVSISTICNILSKHNLVQPEMVQQVRAFVSTGSISLDPVAMRAKAILYEEEKKATASSSVTLTSSSRPVASALSFEERAALAGSSIGRKLFEVMARKQTNLCLSADVTSSAELLDLVDRVGPHICLLKTHIDILSDFSEDVLVQLQALARKHDFLIFEDRKYADIGNTVVHQYSAGVHHPSTWSDMVNAHLVAGPDVIPGLKKVGLPLGRGLILLAEMSSRGNRLFADDALEAASWAENHPDFVMGFICQGAVSSNPGLLHMTPGIKKLPGIDSMGQQYNTPATALAKGTDIIIVGRGITQASDPAAEARLYQQLGWDAYLKRTQSQLRSRL